MTNDRRQEARRLFMEVADLSAEEQAAALTEACAGDSALRDEVDALLQAEARAGRFMADPTSDAAGADDEPATIAVTPRESAGQQIDRYKLLEQIGEGGFGSVWAAEQKEPVKRRVALKIIKLGMDTRQVIARFEAERQALAMMDHPNIARVLDAGTTETGRPFFVMELVKGVPILEYCDTEKLDTKSRLDLFTQVCHAIQHAHQKGIIHRDIKPSNVLVTMHDGTPVPKVIDFGIAKATNAELTERTVYTQHRQMIGTPAYMSPEQAEMSGLDIDTRSDIYALGVLLYEMLTGTTPFTQDELMEAGFEGMMRIIRETEPHKPSTRLSSLGDTATRTAQQRRADVKQLGLLLRGDLDWIVMKCLEKDRTRRYETANGLAADIQRHLTDEPVLAGPPSTGYRLRKFIKRNRGQVIAGGVVAAALVLGVVGTTGGMVWALSEKARADEAAASERIAKVEAQGSEERAIKQAERAELAEADAIARAEELEQVAEFQSEQLSAIEPEVMGIQLRLALLDSVPAEERESLSEALAPVNFTNLALGTLEENIFERTIEAIDTQFAEQPLVRTRLLQTVAETLRDVGLLELATDPQERALALRREVLGDEHPDTLRSINDMGRLLQSQGKLSEAEPYYLEALETRRVLGDEHPDTLASILNLGYLQLEQGKLAEAEPYLREALEGFRRVLGDEHPDTLNSVNNMGVLLQDQGKLDETEPYYLEALETRRRVLGDDHPSTLTSINSMGVLLQAQGKLDEAEPYYLEAMESSRRVLGDEHPSTLASINNMATLLKSQGKLSEAERYQRETLEVARRMLGDEHPITLASINNMATLLKSQGKLDEAEPYYREALEIHRRVLGDEHPNTLVCINNMGGLLKSQGKFAEAEPFFREPLQTSRRVLGNDHPGTLRSINSMGALLLHQGKLSEAEPYYREVLERARRVLGDEHPNTLVCISGMGVLLVLQGKLAEAEPYYREALEGRRRVLGDEHPGTLTSIMNMAELLKRQGKLADAEPYLREAMEGFRRVLGDEHPDTLRSINIMGGLLWFQGKLAKAEPYYREALEGRRRALGNEHPHTLITMINLARVLADLGRGAESLELINEAVETGRRVLGNEDRQIGICLGVRGRALQTLGRFDEAAETMLDAHAILTAAVGDEHEQTQRVVGYLADLYDEWHEAEPDAGHDAEAAEWRARMESVGD